MESVVKKMIEFFLGLVAMGVVWFVTDWKQNPYERGFYDGYTTAKENDGISV